MDRRIVLAALPAFLLLPRTLAAQSRPLVEASATSGGNASLTRDGRTARLQVGSRSFRLGLPPASQMGNFEIQDLIARPVAFRAGGASVQVTLADPGSGGFIIQGGLTGRFRVQSRAEGAAAGFLVIVVTAAAALGEGLGRGGPASLTRVGPNGLMHDTAMSFLLEVEG